MAISNDDPFLDCAPPWNAFPEMDPSDLPRHLTQGEAERYLEEWHKFWMGLAPERKEEYLVHWQASEQWRDALQALEVDPALDLADDAAESEEHLERWRSERGVTTPRTFWQRLFQRRS